MKEMLIKRLNEGYDINFYNYRYKNLILKGCESLHINKNLILYIDEMDNMKEINKNKYKLINTILEYTFFNNNIFKLEKYEMNKNDINIIFKVYE